MQNDQADGSVSTARHWIGVYSRLASFAADVDHGGQLEGETARRLRARRLELDGRLRYWQLELSRALGGSRRPS